MVAPLLALPWLVGGGIAGGKLGQKIAGNRPFGVSAFDWGDFQRAQQGGYAYGYNQWIREGKPKAAQVTMSKEEALARQSERKVAAKERGQKEVSEKAARTVEEKEKWEREKWERDFAERQRQFNEQQKTRELESGVKTYAKYGMNPYDNPKTPEEEGQWNPYAGQYEPPPGWISPADQTQRDWQKQQMSFEQQKWAEQMAWSREQSAMQQEEQKRQYTAQLASQPMSWLQYSSYTGQTPAVQPWMLPLMSGQYSAGQAIPNWQGGEQTGQAQSMSALPELRNPSMQYFARMGPTAQQQYMGYQQARTGIRPEETMFRQRATAAPSGRFSGLRWMR